jgi:hypothetical protein
VVAVSQWYLSGISFFHWQNLFFADCIKSCCIFNASMISTKTSI